MSDDDFPSVTYTAPASRVWWVVGGLAVLVLLTGGVALRVAFSNLPPQTTVAGITVRTPAEATRVADEIATRLIGLPVELRTVAGTTTVSAGRLGATLGTADLRAQADEATGADAWIERFTGGGPVELTLDVMVGGADLDEVVAEVTRDPVDGDLTLTAGAVDVTDPVPGVRVDDDQILTTLSPALAALTDLPSAEWPMPLVVELEGEEIAPMISQVAVDAALDRLETMTAGPVELTASVVPEDAQTVDGEGIPTREEARLLLSPTELRQMLTTAVDPGAIERQRLQIVADPGTPPESLTTFLDRAAVVPDMTVEVRNRSAVPPRGAGEAGPGGPADRAAYADISGVTGDLVAVVTRPGLEPDVDATIEAVVDAMQSPSRAAAVQGDPVNTPDPGLLGILQPVSTYTTFYTPGEGRVTNIHRIAEILDGTLVPPGANLDINHAAGERTAAGGFVSAGAILDGEFVSDIGGGVSQFGTTFFNAMWFAGLDIITHTPHSFWFDRYPAGREATIDYPGVNLEFNNNTPYWVLVDTFVTDDSVTVTFWSTPYFQVTQSIGPMEPVPGENFRIAIERVATAPALPELELPGFVDDDRFVQTYGIAP